VNLTDLTVACKLFDASIDTAGISSSVAAVGVLGETLCHRDFYFWIVFMFGDCNQEDPLSQQSRAKPNPDSNRNPKSLTAIGGVHQWM